MEIIFADEIESSNPNSSLIKLKWEFFNKFPKWNDILTVNNLELNLERINIIGHDGLIWIAYICLIRRINNLNTDVKISDNAIVNEWMKSLGIQVLQQQLDFTFIGERFFPPTSRFDNSKSSGWNLDKIQLITLDTWSNVSGTAIPYTKNILNKLFQNQPADQITFEEITPFSETIYELIHNIALHAGPEKGKGIGLAVFRPWSAKSGTIRFCCSDVGLGFSKTLNSKLQQKKINTDLTSILEALLYRYFFPEDGIYGLYHTLRLIRRRSGKLCIRSGSVLGTLDLSSEEIKTHFDKSYTKPSYEWLKRIMRFSTVTEIPGVHIFVDFKIPSFQR